MPVICTKEQETHRLNVKVELCLDQDSLSVLSFQESQHHSIFPGDEYSTLLDVTVQGELKSELGTVVSSV